MPLAADQIHHVREALAERYRVEDELGRGGMATVYLATDRRHDRQVAVKVLRPDVAATIGVQRFLREIEIAARLTHPHILDLHDSGEVQGVLFYVMPYLTGGSLRGRLVTRDQLPRGFVITTTREVAGALAYAHVQGVIHRDIKPENILLSHGHAMVADFGIAKALSSVGHTNLTRSGFPLGTPGYMSPEQAAGLTDLDERTDVYSLGCVVYEMLIGGPPGLWPTEEALRLQRFVDASPEHRRRLDSLPGRWEQALVTSLAMRRADRFASPVDLARALEQANQDRRRYDPEAVRRIIGRAATAQAESRAGGEGLSFATIESIAAEVGIPADLVRVAARDPSGAGSGSDPPGRYADRDAQAIIARAAQIQADRETGTGALSLGAVEQVGAEVGIPPERVREAIRALEPPSREGPLLFGKPSTLVAERRLPRPMDALDRSEVARLMREALGAGGWSGDVNQAYVWSLHEATTTAGNVLLVMEPDGTGTLIRLQHDLTDLGGEVSGSAAGWLAGGLAGVAVAVGVGAGTTSALPFLGIAAATAGAYGASRWFFVQEARQRRRALDALAERLLAALR